MYHDFFSNLHVPITSTNRGLLNCQSHVIITQIRRCSWTDKYHSSWWWNHDQTHPKTLISWSPKHPEVIFRFLTFLDLWHEWLNTYFFICRWTTSLISIVLPSTISRAPTTPYPYPARQRWTDWLHLAIFISGSTSSKPIKRNEIIAIRADHLVIMVVVTVDGTNDSIFPKKKSSVCHFYFLTTDHNSLL